jgi:hypothetical protein
MFLLSCVLGLLILLSLLDVIKTSIYLKIVVFFFSGALLIILASLRYGDRDYFNYLDIYGEIAPFFEVQKYKISHGEPGYLLLNKFCKTIGIGGIGVFFITAFSSVSLSLIFFKKNTKYFFIALLIYFSHVFLLRDMLQIRSGLAASICLFAYPYIAKRNFWKFLYILLLAMSFHAGAGIMLLVYVLYPYFLIKDKYLIYFVILGYLLGFMLSTTMLEFFFVEIFDVPGVSLYTSDSEYFRSLGLLNPVLLKSSLVLFILYFYRFELRVYVKFFDAFLVSLCIAVFWLAALNNFSILAARLATYLSNSELVLIPSLFYTNIHKGLLWVTVVCYCIFMFRAKFETFQDLTFLFFNF